LASIFDPALFISLLGQFIVHLFVTAYLVYETKRWVSLDHESHAPLANNAGAMLVVNATSTTAAAMVNGTLNGTLNATLNATLAAAAARATKLAAVVEKAQRTFKPGLLNSVVFLVSATQQVGVFVVNFKGAPCMRGLGSNTGLLASLVMTAVISVVCALELMPSFNLYLQLVPLPDAYPAPTNTSSTLSAEASLASGFPASIAASFRWRVLLVLLFDFVTTFVWDRLVVVFFAPALFRAQWGGEGQSADSLMSTKRSSKGGGALWTVLRWVAGTLFLMWYCSMWATPAVDKQTVGAAASMAAVHAGSGAELMPGLLEAMAAEGLNPIGGADLGLDSEVVADINGTSWWWPF
jgi:hypothetical protein